MANITQIYSIVNDAASEALGSKALTVKDTAGFVSLGNVVLSSTDDTDAFYKALVDRIGRTVIAVREWEIKGHSVKRDEMEWGIIYQKISFKKKEAVANPSWVADSHASPYDIEVSTEAVQKLFSVMGTYSYEDSIPYYQLETAFTSSDRMGAFISGIWTNMYNDLKLTEENLKNLAVATLIGGVLISGKDAQKRNLLAEYNTATGSSLTAAAAYKDPDFIRFATYEIGTVMENFKSPTTIYNPEGIPRQTPADRLVVDMLTKFEKASEVYLQSDTYHKELVSLPMFNSINFWQSTGESFAFEDVSTINIENVNLATADNETGAVRQSGILCAIYDYDAVASIIYRRRDYTKFNERTERLNVMLKADTGMMCDMSEQVCVFYISDDADDADDAG